MSGEVLFEKHIGGMGQGNQERPSNGQLFRSAYGDQSLLIAVRDVAVHVDPDDPTAVTQRAFDRARADAGHPRLPSARQIASRLGRSWPAMLKLARDRDLEKATGRSLGSETARWLTPEYVASWLRVIATRLGQETLRPDAFVRVREQILRENRRHYLHRTSIFIPTESQVRHTAGSWDEALALAGLSKRSEKTYPRPRGVPITVAQELHLQLHGSISSSDRLVAFARVEGFSLEGRRQRPIKLFNTQLREARAARGLWTPVSCPKRGEPRPDYSKPCDKDAEGDAAIAAALANVDTTNTAPRRGRVTEADCEVGVEAFIRQLPKGANPSARAYQEFVRAGKREHPWPESMRQFGGWKKIKLRVQKRLANQGHN